MTPFRTLLWAKRRIAAHNFASIRHESRLKIGVVSISAVMLWVGVLVGFLQGFLWLSNFEPSNNPDLLSVGDILMARLLSVFALALFFMLIFSNVLIAFSTIYKAREVHYLVQSPLSVRAFFLARLIECISFSSWASAYLGSPLIIAYGITTDAPLLYYLAAVAFYVPFVTIPAALGTLITLVLVRVFPRLPRAVFFVSGGITVGWLFLYVRRTFSEATQANDSFLQAILSTAAQTQSPLLPSYWASQGLLASAELQYSYAGYLFLLLVSNALMACWVATEAAERLFLSGFSGLLGRDSNRPRPQGKGILGRIDGMAFFLPQPIRSLVLKDVRLFWRDPTQWTQFVVFFGIMAIYVANLGNTSVSDQSDGYRSWIAGLNSASCSLILASLTSRFVYPLISLEGFRFWILGLAPLTLKQLMWQKFWLSIATTAPFTLGLVILSCTILEVGSVRFGVAVYSIVLANFTLAGLAVGLGSLYPNFQEDNPARVVSGMGGTLNFLLSVGYITILAVTQMVIFQWEALARYTSLGAFGRTLVAILVLNTLISLLGVYVPMKLGLRNLMKLEF